MIKENMQSNRLIKFWRNYSTFCVIFLIAGFFRLYKIGSVPPSPSLDEVSIGYNAFSILKTGKDEYSTHWPILLRAYDDYRPALYVYFVAPFVQVLGLTVEAVRMPSVIFSILTVLIAYLIVKELFNDEKYLFKVGSILIDPATITALLLAISPWHIYLSRLGHEANLGLLFTVAALYSWIIFIKRKKSIFLYISVIVFVFSFYSYQSQKLLVPLFVIVLIILYWKILWKNKRDVVIAGFIACFLSFPMIFASLSPGGLIRFQATNVFSNNNFLYEESSRQFLAAKISKNLLGQLWYSYKITGLRIVVDNYISHFAPTWLFLGKAKEDHKIPHLGLLYWWEAPIILLGLVFFFRSKLDKKFKILILFWFLSSPLPASITTGAPHVMRSYTFLPTWQIFGALGIVFLGIQLQKRFIYYYVAIVGTVILLSMGYLYQQYFYNFPVIHSSSFQYALSKAMTYEKDHQLQYSKIIFSNQNNLYQSYMFFLFFNKYDPIQYQKEGGSKSGGFNEFHAFNKYEFRRIDWSSEYKSEKTLLIGNVSDFPIATPFVGDIPNLDGTPAIRIVSL